ncbi:EpsG family protein [Neobacillus sp. DY30]|uniref:EpsG family protein n=1 Tax=Neobacillus sp. DY30 TaxID=3047871 RepID=UPI0024BF2FCD|nr:EpsG family protein [Neobacillus sp. DY30]WHY00417.1 EpsG family protein [Neobacillus sp. DY30]
MIISLMIIVVLLMPLRIDMVRYLGVFEASSSLSWYAALSSVRWEPGFVTYQWMLSKVNTSKTFFILITSIIMWIIIVSALKKNISFKSLPLILFGYISLFPIYNLFSNVLRQGFAICFLMFMIVYLADNYYKKAFIFFIITLSFHVSASIAGILFIVKRFNISIKNLCIVFVISSILLITGINQKLMTNIAVLFGGRLGDSVISYSSESVVSIYGSVNRIDFLIFTSIWIVWGLYFRNRFLMNDKIFEWLLKAYLSFSIIYVLFGFIGFSDRLASYAWFLIPILLYYPAIKMESRFQFIWIIICIIISILLFVYFGTYSLYEPLKLLY